MSRLLHGVARVDLSDEAALAHYAGTLLATHPDAIAKALDVKALRPLVEIGPEKQVRRGATRSRANKKPK